MSGIDPTQFQEIYNLVISTESAQILAQGFSKKDFWSILTIVLPLITTIVSIIIAINSLKIAKKANEISTQIAHNSFVNNIHKLFFDLLLKAKHPPTITDIENFCNYFEYVFSLYYQDTLLRKDLKIFSDVIKDKTFTKFATERNSTNKNLYSDYLKYLKEFKLI